MNLLTMEHITKAYTDRVLLNDVAFSINENEKIGVIDVYKRQGASISSLHGMEKAKGKEYIKNWVAVIGDSTFLHTGVNSLMNMMYNKATGTVKMCIRDRYTYLVEPSIAMSGIYRTRQRIRARKGKIKKIEQTDRGFYLLVEIDE